MRRLACLLCLLAFGACEDLEPACSDRCKNVCSDRGPTCACVDERSDGECKCKCSG